MTFNKKKFDAKGIKIVEVQREVVEREWRGGEVVKETGPAIYRLTDLNDQPIELYPFGSFPDAVEAIAELSMPSANSATPGVSRHDLWVPAGRRIVRVKERPVAPDGNGNLSSPDAIGKLVGYHRYNDSKRASDKIYKSLKEAAVANGFRWINTEWLGKAERIGWNFLIWLLTAIALYVWGKSNDEGDSAFVQFNEFIDHKLVIAHILGFSLGVVVIFILFFLLASGKFDENKVKRSFVTVMKFLGAWGDVIVNFGSISLSCGILALLSSHYSAALPYIGAGLLLYAIGAWVFYKR